MIPTFFLPATVLRSAGEWPCTSALGLLTRRYSALRSNVSPLSKAMVSALPSLCNRSSVGHGVVALPFMATSLLARRPRATRQCHLPGIVRRGVRRHDAGANPDNARAHV